MSHSADRCLVIIQARLGSTRFPQKILAPIDGRPMIACVVERARDIHGVSSVVVASPASDAERIQQAVSARSIGYWRDKGGVWRPHVSPPVIAVRGNENDVLYRYAAVSDLLPGFQTIMRLTGDCPFLNPQIAADVLALFRRHTGCQYATNATPGYRDGEDVEVFSRAWLREANARATDPSDREHVTPWMRRHATRSAVLMPEPRSKTEKCSIDTYDEYQALGR